MAESLQEAVGRMAIVGVGAVGLGTAVSILATTAAADVTGLVAAGRLCLWITDSAAPQASGAETAA